LGELNRVTRGITTPIPNISNITPVKAIKISNKVIILDLVSNKWRSLFITGSFIV
jgi:hypothetical protein